MLGGWRSWPRSGWKRRQRTPMAKAPPKSFKITHGHGSRVWSRAILCSQRKTDYGIAVINAQMQTVEKLRDVTFATDNYFFMGPPHPTYPPSPVRVACRIFTRKEPRSQ
jgi:hypothetical protein